MAESLIGASIKYDAHLSNLCMTVQTSIAAKTRREATSGVLCAVVSAFLAHVLCGSPLSLPIRVKVLISVTCPEALMGLSAMVFYIVRRAGGTILLLHDSGVHLKKLDCGVLLSTLR